MLGLAVLMILLLCGTALATDVEIHYPNVNIRETPGGKPVGRLSGGEVLPAVEETWANGQLWYHVKTEQYGDGYVSGEFARPIYAEERIFDPENPTNADYITENVAAFYTSLLRWLYTYDYCYWDADEQGPNFRVHHMVGDESVVRPIHKWEIAFMLARYGLLVENGMTAVIRDTDAPSETKMKAASTVLKNHFGTDDIWDILLSQLLLDSEAHAPNRTLSSRDVLAMAEIWDTVNEEFKGKRTVGVSETLTDGNLILYYNPDGGSRYHVDRNCASTNPKYLPFSGQFTYAEVNDEAYMHLMPCNVCDAPLR